MASTVDVTACDNVIFISVVLSTAHKMLDVTTILDKKDLG